MKLYRISSAFLSLSIAFVFVSHLSCNSHTPTSPSSDTTIKRSSDQLQFLKPQRMGFYKKFQGEQLITASDGGSIVVGDDSSGYSGIYFMPGDLSGDEQIQMIWDPQNFAIDFYPHGLQFSQPVEIRLSYQNANIENINEQDIQIWYLNELENVWELIGGNVDQLEKSIEGSVRHFSRYALASDD